MDTPLVISGAGHLGVALVLVFGGLFPNAPEPAFESAEVTVMSEEEFAALTRPETAEEPTPPPLRPSEDSSGVVDEAAPEDLPPAEAPRTADPAPAPEPEPEPEPAPEPEPEPAPAPEPEPEPAPPAAPDLPRAAEETPAPAPRVAPDPAPQPPAPAETAPDTREAVQPDPAPEAPQVLEEEPPTAPEAAAPEIVTEAEDPATRAAPDVTGRPRTRPVRQAVVEPESESEPEEPELEPDPAPRTEGETSSASSDAIADAVRDTIAGLEERLETGELDGAPAGPPLTRGEQGDFKLAIQRCWNVDVGSEAADVTISVRFAMNSDNTVVSGSLRQISASGGSPAAQRTAFEWARRAILRCQVEGGGYDLPVEKYAQWQQVVVTFNPREMRVR